MPGRLSGLELQRRSVWLEGVLGILGDDMVMGKILFAVRLVRAPALADADIHARIVPFFLTNDIIRHCTLL